MRYSPDGSLLAVLGAGKSLEVFSVRAAEEARKKLKRRKKRKREKAGKVRRGRLAGWQLGACLCGALGLSQATLPRAAGAAGVGMGRCSLLGAGP